MDTPKTNDKATGLEKLVVGLELIAGAIVAGTFLANALSGFFKPDEDQPKASETKPDSVVAAEEVSDTGYSLLNRSHFKDQSIHDFIRQKYHGLWLIGRVGGHIRGRELDALAAELGHYHQQSYTVTGHDTDRALVAWYETVGVGNRLSLVGLLLRSPIVDSAFSADRYAASAITGDRDNTLTYELQADEWDQIKRHLSV